MHLHLRNIRNWGLRWHLNTISLIAEILYVSFTLFCRRLVFFTCWRTRSWKVSGFKILDRKPPGWSWSCSLSNIPGRRVFFELSLGQAPIFEPIECVQLIRVPWLSNLSSRVHTKLDQLWLRVGDHTVPPQVTKSLEEERWIKDMNNLISLHRLKFRVQVSMTHN